MKHKVFAKHLLGAAFAFLLSVGAIGSICSGLELPVDSMLHIIVWCGIFAVASSVLFWFRHGGRIIIGLGVLALLILWKNEALLQQVQTLIYLISSCYHDAYEWPVFGNLIVEEVSFPLIIWAALMAVCVNRYFCRRGNIFAVLPPVILPLALCLVVTDTVPNTIYLYILALCLGILLITDWTRHNREAQGIKLTLRMTVPLAVFFALLFCMNPQQTYVNNAGKLQKEVISWFKQSEDTTQSVIDSAPADAAASKEINLQQAGPKSNIAYSVMRINAPVNGAVYLRGRDYDEYSGTGWKASEDRREDFSSRGPTTGELTIVTYAVRDVLYVPYYATQEIRIVGGAYRNDQNIKSYSYSLSKAGISRSVSPDFRYTELPNETRLWATGVVNKIIDRTATLDDRIRQIQDYVRDSATYDRSTSRMDAQHSDFAKWFLEESETGYCVHFATAATVLLRAAGIPARYVEGYMVRCNAGESVVVSNQDAHAWAEYYDIRSGVWRILEATPADWESSTDDKTEPNETQTEPERTEPETSDIEDENTDPSTSPEDTPGIPNDLPGNQDGHGGVSVRSFKWLGTAFKGLLAVAIVLLQRYVRLFWKRKQWTCGKPNEKTIARWRQTRKLAKLLKQPYPVELDGLAQKAKFSQHRIQPAELQQFEDYRQALQENLCTQPWYLRFLFHWILIISW